MLVISSVPHSDHVVVDSQNYLVPRREIWSGGSHYFSTVVLMMEGRGGMPGSWSQKGGALEADTVQVAADQSARVEPSEWFVLRRHGEACWDIDLLLWQGRRCGSGRLAAKGVALL